MAKRRRKQKKFVQQSRRSTRHRYNYVTLRKINMEKFTRINTLPRIIFIKKKKKIRKEERQKKYR